MAHEIDYLQNGERSMLYIDSEGPPWHGLGTPVHGAANAADVRRLALDFEVYKVPLYVPDGLSGNYALVPGQHAVVRTGRPAGQNVLGLVADGYVPIQNEQALALGDILFGEGAACYHTAGSLKGGQIIWLLMKSPDGLEVAGDLIDKFILLTNCHTGKGSATLMFTPVRVVCNNTLDAALAGRGPRARIWHTGHVEAKMRKAADLLGMVNMTWDKTGNLYRKMAAKGITMGAAAGYFGTVIPGNPDNALDTRAKHVRAQMLYLFEHGAGQESTAARGTVWGAYNAVTEWVGHCRLPKCSPERRLWGDWFGGGARIREAAFAEAVKLSV